MIGEGVESMLLLDLEEADEVESYLKSGGESAEEIEGLRSKWGCRSRFGRSSRGEKPGKEEMDGSLVVLGGVCFCRITKEGQSLSFKIEKTRSRVFR